MSAMADGVALLSRAGLIWCEKKGDGDGASWFYQGASCELRAVGVREGETTPCVIEIRLSNGGLEHVWADETGEFPHLMFDANAPGH
jgi:hypothetical protein